MNRKKPGHEQVADNRTLEERIAEALAKTGFLLENQVAEAFREAKWGVINGRYYVDDVDGRARELDLIAYKVKVGKEVDVVTTVLVSCKKDAEHLWAVMSRSRQAQDPNMDWEPVHCWTNNDVLDAYLGSVEWRHSYVTGDKRLDRDLFSISRQAFAFQLVTIDGKIPKNDRPIFESLTDLMKAQDHELSILPARMKKNRVYIFNLLTVVDAPIYEVKYDAGSPVASEVLEFRHLARYIVKKADRAARVQIASKKILKDLVSTYSDLAEYDRDYFNGCVNDAYKLFIKNQSVQSVLAKKLARRTRWLINYALREDDRVALRAEDEFTFSFDEAAKQLVLHAPFRDGDAEFLNNDQELKKEVKVAIESVLRYSGSFRFGDEEIPF